MRPLRLLLALLSCVAAITLLLYISIPSPGPRLRSSPAASPKTKGGFRALFSFSTPSLFPPSAIISLTDDNSTFFLARPAAFGPTLPSRGLSGQLWIGSGFGDDTLGRGGLAAGAEGELGCSDVPGWNEGDGRPGTVFKTEATTLKTLKRPSTGPLAGTKVSRSAEGNGDEDLDASSVARNSVGGPKNDGTDDHLHHPITNSWLSKSIEHTKGVSEPPEHADIQSLQESAEISGKVVLLSRGGCGFLEKVKWAQRRGGVAVIVGDNLRGGPLVTMYARGDTANISIPALFTSHTTAHLLSSLIPSGGYLEDIPAVDAARLGTEPGSKASRIAANRPASAKSNMQPKQSPSSQTANKLPSKSRYELLGDDVEVSVVRRGQRSWIGSILRLFGSAPDDKISSRDSRRPPSSGNIDWILAEDWEDQESGSNAAESTSSGALKDLKPTASKLSGDNFVIGVHDWRDPDLLPQSTSVMKHDNPNDRPSKTPSGIAQPQGGNVVPGSGEYGDAPSHEPIWKQTATGPPLLSKYKTNENGMGWLDNLWGSGHHEKIKSESTPRIPAKTMSTTAKSKPSTTFAKNLRTSAFEDTSKREGLWVTLTPTSVSSSPFFDTLLVLVVSPLVTLTVVYALLLLRSRIRRRRWRAPKSVVERLPVRTYHTISSDSSNSSSPVATSAAASSRTPLLHSTSSYPRASRSRPRSRTASEVPERTSSERGSSRDRSESPDQEKGEAGLAAWRRKYGGRQKECVVCLEEYVDGVSRVMSLPCGHEFHAECITPWLTTRRRTCPICKGDVVRSLAGASTSASSRAHGIGIPGIDDVQEQAAERRNDSPSATRPVSAVSDSSVDLEIFEDENDADLERGDGGRGDEGAAAWIRDGLSDVRNAIRRRWVVWIAGRGRVDEPDPEDFDRDR